MGKSNDFIGAFFLGLMAISRTVVYYVEDRHLFETDIFEKRFLTFLFQPEVVAKNYFFVEYLELFHKLAMQSNK